jgi:hypothetical protein
MQSSSTASVNKLQPPQHTLTTSLSHAAHILETPVKYKMAKMYYSMLPDIWHIGKWDVPVK